MKTVFSLMLLLCTYSVQAGEPGAEAGASEAGSTGTLQVPAMRSGHRRSRSEGSGPGEFQRSGARPDLAALAAAVGQGQASTSPRSAGAVYGSEEGDAQADGTEG